MGNRECCPICFGKESRLFMKKNAWNNRDGVELRKCQNCGFVFSVVSEYQYEDNGDGRFVAKTKAELLEIAKSQNLDKIIDEIIEKSGLQPGSKILDFGCGMGLASTIFKERGFQVFSVEKYKPFIANLDVKTATDLAEFASEKGTFDLIFLKDVLEHLDEPVKVVKTLKEYLKPDGYFYIRVPNVYHYPFYWAIDTKAHINHFTPRILDKLFAENKFKKIGFIGVHDIRTIFGKMYNTIFWNLRYVLPMYHQISVLYRRNK